MNEIVKIETTQLEAVVKNSGLILIEAEEIKQAYLPFLARLIEIQSQAEKINFENPALLDEKISRELRLATVKIRTDAEKLKDEQKRVDLLRSKVKQDSFNLIASSCKLAEEVFFNVEKAREIAEKKRKEQSRIERSEKLAPYCESVMLYPLGEMSEEQFTELYTGLRTAHEMKIEADRKAEEKRLADAEAERKRQEEIRLENEKLKAEAERKQKELEAEREKVRKENEQKERLAEIERQKQAQILKAEQDRARDERDKLIAQSKKEREEKERLAELKRQVEAKRNNELRPYIIFIRDYGKMISLDEKEYQKEFADIQRAAKEHYQFEAEQKAKADNEKAELYANMERERNEKERLEAEIKRKKDADEKAKRDADRAKAAAEKNAKLAPDKEKLQLFLWSINALARPQVKSIEAADIASKANIMLVKVAEYVKDGISKL